MMTKRIVLLFFFAWCMSVVVAQPLEGKTAFPISLKDPAGKTITLESFRGKWVLVDFWASWCGPCRASNREVRKVYPSWKMQGVEVLGVSLDEDRGDWIRAIKKDRITWPQVQTPAQWDSPLVLQWQVERIPTTYLIDPKGVIRVTDPEPASILDFIKRNTP